MSETNGSGNSGKPPLSDADRKRLSQEEAKSEFSKLDAIMEPTTIGFVDQYLEAGGAPFNIMNLLMSSYEGFAAMANMVTHDISAAYEVDAKTAVLDTISRQIVEGFDANKADEEYNRTQHLPQYIDEMTPHRTWRKTIYRLSEKYPKSTMINDALQRIAEQGHQAEMTSLNSTSLHTHVFYSLLTECLENITPADDQNINKRMQELLNAVCRGEQTYILAQYLLQNVRHKLGKKNTASLRRIEQELESYILDNYDLPQLAIHVRLLLDGRAVGGNDVIADAIAAIIQSGYAAPGDVNILYKQYHNAFSSGQHMPPVELLREERVFLPIMHQAFGHLWSSSNVMNTRTELMDKYLWLIAYATLYEDGEQKDVSKQELLKLLVSQMKEIREELPIHPNQTSFNRIIRRVIDWISVPVLARIVLLWVRDMLSDDGFAYYETYFHSSEVPIPLLLLEEIAYRHPLLKPLVFSVYKESFESRVKQFMPEKQIRLQRTVVNRIATLVQLDYALPVLQYLVQQAEMVDESVTVYFIYRVLVQFDPPYPKEFYKPILEVTERVMESVKVAKEKELEPIRQFLESIDNSLAKRLCNLLPVTGSSTP
ncbi:hypothetical protein GGI25_000231 [Coemansia spiralis]|uniref:TH1 protein n=1 Tax=Coemansia spiralis TaxID=417178 RepID=A0A9W8GC80_9FUNG|nr:hypothetical protein GGI26_000265 [Coemansia sp. RSA 1358]KAJ2680927.1 hypothetical protein GGI25_000231 [Coemansia spiralis]